MKYTKKEFDGNIFNENSLSLLNIRELRDLGRKFGISSPTTMNKDSLIEYILKVVYGEVKPATKEKRGRPIAKKLDAKKYFEKIKNENSFEDDFLKIVGDYGDLKLASPKQRKNLDCLETRIFSENEGVCKLKIKQFIDLADDIVVSKEFANEFKLENLDVVEILKQKNLFKIATINGNKVEDKFKKMEISDEEISAGEIKVFYLRTKEEKEKEIQNLRENCKDRKIELFEFLQDEKESLNENKVVYFEKEDISKIYKKFRNFFDLVEKAMFENKDVAVMIDDSDLIEKIILAFDSDVSARIKGFIEESFEKICNLGNVVVSFKIKEDLKY